MMSAVLDPDLWRFLSIPVMSAIVGWGTNVLALKMTFYPLDFIGVPPLLGWQGIIPAKAESMARRTVNLITTRLVGVEEVIDRLQPDPVVEALSPGVEQMLRNVIDESMSELHPALWSALPQAAHEEIYARAAADADEVIRESLTDLKLEIDDVLDLEEMAVSALLADRAFLNQIFLECGGEEFDFIERSGLYFGALFGLILMGVQYLVDSSWVLPVAGFVVGYLTNFLALKMIFEPAEPRKVLGFTWQGSFLKRQEEVSEAYARLITQNIVNTENILRTMFEGPGGEKLLEIIERHVRDATERYEAVPRPVTDLILGSDDYESLKEAIAEQIVAEVPSGPLYHVEQYADEALDLENTLRERLVALPPEQFTGLLRPIFQEDEWKLILVGALLGLLVGVFQVVFVFG
jgi:uncharacterized membrane protein YheB (UPF0754 family)